MSGQNGHWNKECKPRELRQLCHNSFWCGEDRAHAINLSPGGMCFRIARRAEPGEVVTLHQGPTQSVKARIAWTRRLDKCTEVGVQFLDEETSIENWMKLNKEQAEADKAEPILALPAPGHTCRPSFNYQPANSNSSPPMRIGKSWRAAFQIMGTNHNSH